MLSLNCFGHKFHATSYIQKIKSLINNFTNKTYIPSHLIYRPKDNHFVIYYWNLLYNHFWNTLVASQ